MKIAEEEYNINGNKPILNAITYIGKINNYETIDYILSKSNIIPFINQKNCEEIYKLLIDKTNQLHFKIYLSKSLLNYYSLLGFNNNLNIQLQNLIKDFKESGSKQKS